MTGYQRVNRFFLLLFLFFIVGTSGVKTVWASEGPLPATAEAAAEVVLFDNGNIAGVYNKPTKPTIFKLTKTYKITSITNYHWNNAQGMTPGTIGLKKGTTTLGTWQATGRPGQGGVPNAYWDVAPNKVLGPGTYSIVDSSRATWSQNNESGNRGMSRVVGVPILCGKPTSITVPASDPDGAYVVSWGASATAGVNYVLQEAKNATFTAGVHAAYKGPLRSATITGRVAGTYYYRVKATKSGLRPSAWRIGSNGCKVGPDGNTQVKAGKAVSNTASFLDLSPVVTPLISESVSPSSVDQIVSYNDEISVTIPPGILDSARTLSISRAENGPPDLTAPFAETFAFDVSLEGLEQLNGYIEIKVKYDPALLNPEYSDEVQLMAMRWDAGENSWLPLPYQVDTEHQTLSFYTDRLSLMQWMVINPDGAATIP